MPTNETLREYVKRRESELARLLETLFERILPKERELAEVRRVNLTITKVTGNYSNALAFLTLAGSSANADSEATLQAFLARREEELMQQIAALRTEAAPVEKELGTILHAKKALGMEAASEQQLVPAEWHSSSPASMVGTNALALASAYMAMSIKQLVLRALGSAHFPRGATPAELRQFIKNGYGREIPPSSLSPQLSRLKADRKVQHNEGADRWSLTLAGAADVAGGGVHEPAEDRTSDPITYRPFRKPK